MPGVGESPLMTWGEIEGTPFRLDAGDMNVRPQVRFLYYIHPHINPLHAGR